MMSFGQMPVCCGSVPTTIILPFLQQGHRVISIPVSVMHDNTGSPSISTVQEPQAPWSHPTFVPVRPRVSLSVWASICEGENLIRLASHWCRRFQVRFSPKDEQVWIFQPIYPALFPNDLVL